MTWRASISRRRTTSAIANTPARRNSSAEKSARTGPSPSRFTPEIPSGRPLRVRLGRRAGARAGMLLEAERRRLDVRAARLQPGRDERVVVVAGDDHDLRAGTERAAQLLQDGTRDGHRLAGRALAQLD